MKLNSEARPSTVFLFYYASIFTILQPLGSGYHEIKVNELPEWDWAQSDGTKAANWGSLKGYLCECLFVCLFCCCCCCFAVIHSTCKHALRKESKSCGRFGTLRWSAPKKCQDHFIFVIIVEWISPVRHRVQKRWPKQLTRNQKL